MSESKSNGFPGIRRADGSVDEEKLFQELYARAPEETLRKLNHREWLGQAAVAFETQWRETDVPITPFRQGLVTRLRLAADYIDLLEREGRQRKIALKMLQEDLANALAALKEPSSLKGTGA